MLIIFLQNIPLGDLDLDFLGDADRFLLLALDGLDDVEGAGDAAAALSASDSFLAISAWNSSSSAKVHTATSGISDTCSM